MDARKPYQKHHDASHHLRLPIQHDPNEAKKALDDVKEGRHVQIIGTASPEGSKAFNDRLSQNRADVVAKYLQSRGVIVDEAKGQGVQGVTSNRLAVVYVK